MGAPEGHRMTGQDEHLSVEVLEEMLTKAVGLHMEYAGRAERAEIENANLRRELTEARDRYENRSPTQWAYEQACKALETHRERADQAEAERDRLGHLLSCAGQDVTRLTGDRDRIAADLEAYTNDVLSVMNRKNAAAERLEAELTRLREALQRVRALHIQFVCGCGADHGMGCAGCCDDWPCPTIAALGQDGQEASDET